MAKVGRHFEAREFGALTTSEAAGVGALCALLLDPMRDRFGSCRVWSGERSEAKNRAVGGAPNSRHLYERFPLECAADVTFARGTPGQWAALARQLANRHGRGGVGLYSSHVHVDLGPRRDW